MKEQEAVSEEAAVEIVPDGDEAFGKAKESLDKAMERIQAEMGRPQKAAGYV